MARPLPDHVTPALNASASAAAAAASNLSSHCPPSYQAHSSSSPTTPPVDPTVASTAAPTVSSAARFRPNPGISPSQLPAHPQLFDRPHADLPRRRAPPSEAAVPLVPTPSGGGAALGGGSATCCRMDLDTAATAAAAPYTPGRALAASPAAVHRTPHTPAAAFAAVVPADCRGSTPAHHAAASAYASLSGQQRLPPATPVACGQAVHSLAAMAVDAAGMGTTSPYVLAAGRDKTIRAYAPDGSLCLQHTAHIDRIWSVLPLDSTTIASASADRTVRLWRIASRPTIGESYADGAPLEMVKLGTLSGHTDGVQALLQHQGLLVSGSSDCTIRLWDYRTREMLSVCSMPTNIKQSEHTAVYSLAHTGPEALNLWSGHWGGSLNQWDARTGQLLRNLEQVHEGPVWGMQSLPHTPELMASGGADGAIRLWDARSLGQAGELQAGSPVYAVAATAGGSESLLVSAGYDGCLKLWDVRSLKPAPLTNLQAHSAPIRSLLVSEGAVWSGSTDGTLRCWDLSHLPLSVRQPQAPDTFAV
uniref:Guanine nucleotide-binding protein subunit beta-like protein n=1 Tax=Haptolina brevifila TaxID=156173 RepID=A0A7S2IIG6_9EUKA